MKGKTKTQKGITLVALIITIVVLLILAVVAINAITDTDLIAKANSAATTYNQSVANETAQLGNYAGYLDQYLPGGTTGGNGGSTGGETGGDDTDNSGPIKFFITYGYGNDYAIPVTIEYEAVEGQSLGDWFDENTPAYLEKSDGKIKGPNTSAVGNESDIINANETFNCAGINSNIPGTVAFTISVDASTNYNYFVPSGSDWDDVTEAFSSRFKHDVADGVNVISEYVYFCTDAGDWKLIKKTMLEGTDNVYSNETVEGKTYTLGA